MSLKFGGKSNFSNLVKKKKFKSKDLITGFSIFTLYCRIFLVFLPKETCMLVFFVFLGGGGLFGFFCVCFVFYVFGRFFGGEEALTINTTQRLIFHMKITYDYKIPMFFDCTKFYGIHILKIGK